MPEESKKMEIICSSCQKMMAWFLQNNKGDNAYKCYCGNLVVTSDDGRKKWYRFFRLT